jgi:hypothetical protein
VVVLVDEVELCVLLLGDVVVLVRVPVVVVRVPVVVVRVPVVVVSTPEVVVGTVVSVEVSEDRTLELAPQRLKK